MDEFSPVIKKKNTPLPTHCDTPLTLNNARKALLVPAPGQHIYKNNPIRREYVDMVRELQLNDPNLFDLSKVQSFFLNTIEIKHHPIPILEFKQALRLASRLYIVEVQGTLKHLGSAGPNIDINLLLKHIPLLNNYLRKCFWEEAVILSGSDNDHDGIWWNKKGKFITYRKPGLDMIVSRNLFSVQTSSNTILASRDHLTILSDLASERFSIMLQSLIAEQVNNVDTPTYQELNEFLKEGDEILSIAGNQGYDLIYTLEASCTSRSVGNYEGGSWENSKFRKEIERELEEKSTQLELQTQLQSREKLLTTVFNRNINAFTQLYGLYRIWGHPTLDPLLGTIALKALGTTPRFYLAHQAIEINNKFKEEFIKRYINRHKEWPDLDVSKLPRFNIIRIHYERKLHFPFKERTYDRKHLDLITFNQIFPVDPKFDLIEFIDDKSISLGFPDLLNEIYRNKSIGNALSRSLLLNFLSSNISDPQEFLNTIDVSGFPPDEICVGVHEKEREGKLKARLFGLLTLVKRSYVVITEKLLAEHLFPYFPEITMVDDELSLEKKRHNFNLKKGNKFLVSLDFAKWNTNMREPDTHPFYKTLDQMFGFSNCFSRTHEMFFDSYLYLIDGSYIPTITENGFKTDLGCWKHHLGGIEGLRQKGWTLWTVILIRLVAEDFPFKLSIMGQGDNQMLLLNFDPDIPEQYAVDQVNQFLIKLKYKLSLIGPPLKLEETWISKDYYLYGKYPIKNGVSLTTSWKKSCRMFRCCNEDYPTIESSLSSLAANLYAAIAADNRTTELYFLYLFELIGLFQCNIRRPYLQRQSFYHSLMRNRYLNVPTINKKLKKIVIPTVLRSPDMIQDDLLLISLCLLPRTLGGYPVILYPSILIKGAPDQLSYDLASLKIFYNCRDQGIMRIISRIVHPYLSDDYNYSLLLMNPEAINLESTPTPSEARRTTMLEFLITSERVTQPYIREFLGIIQENANSSLEEFLTQPSTLHPRVISLFLQATPQYRAQQVIGRLQKTPTMARVYQKEGSKDLYDLLERSELNHFKSVIRQACGETGRRLIMITDCAVDHSTQLRNKGWNKIIEGVDSVPPHEMFQLEMVDTHLKCSEFQNHDLGFISVRLNTDKLAASNPLNIGSTIPYRGSITKNKINSLSTKIQARTPSLLQRALMVAGLEHWAFEPKSSLSLLAKGLIESITDMPYDTLTPQIDQISGSYQHRLRNDRLDNGGTSPVLPNQGTKIQFNTVPLTCLNKGSKNKNVMFQGPLVMFSTIIGEGLINNSLEFPDTKLCHIHVADPRSMKDLNEDPIEYPPINQTITLLKNPESPFLYFGSEKILPYIKRMLKYPQATKEELEHISVSSRFHSLMAYECINLLDPWSWISNTDPKITTNGITINWALNCNLVELCISVSILLLILFFSPTQTINPEDYIQKVINILKSSPITSWENLTNLCFSEQFPTPLLLFLKTLSPQTSECMTSLNVAVILKTSIIIILQNIIFNKSFLDGKIPHMVAPPAVSFVMHPYRALELINWLGRNSEVYKSNFEYLKKSDLDLKLLNTHGLHVHNMDSWNTPDRLSGISSESLDHLCKHPELKREKESCIFDVDFHINQICLPPVNPILRLKKKSVINNRLLSKDHLIGDDLEPVLKSRDYEAYVFRPAPLPTSGAYKLTSILSNLEELELKKCLCLADGTGGFTRVLSLRKDTEIIYFNTLIRENDYVTQMDPIQNIPDISDLPLVYQRKVKGLREVNDLPSDITNPYYGHQILERFGNNFSLITGDAEDPSLFNSDEVLKIFKAYRDISLIISSASGIFKIHTKKRSIIKQASILLLTYYSYITLIKSPFSLRSNCEYYFVCVKSSSDKMIIPVSYTQKEDNQMILNLDLTPETNLLVNKGLKTNSDKILQSYRRNYTNEITRFLIPHLTSQDLVLYLQSQFLWLQINNFDIGEFKNNSTPPIYSNTIHKWIVSIHRKRYDKGQKDHIRFLLDHFTTRELADILMSFLFLILATIPTSRWNNWIPKFLKEGSLLWVKCKNGLWFFSPYDDVVPDPETTYDFRLHKASDLINHIAIQKLCRCVGLAKMLHFQIPEDKRLQDEIIFTKPSRVFEFNDSQLQGLQDKVKPFNWSKLSDLPTYKTTQFYRIKGNI